MNTEKNPQAIILFPLFSPSSAINPILYNAMSVKFRRAFGRTLSCGKHQKGESAYWGYATRATTTYTCANSGLPSKATLNYNANSSVRGPSPGRDSSSSSSSTRGLKSNMAQPSSQRSERIQLPVRRKQGGTTFPPVDIVIDSSDAILPCGMEDDETDQLVKHYQVTQL